MKILYLAHRIPYPPDKGDKIRAFHQLRRLSDSARIDLLTLVDDPADWPHVADLEELCASVTAVGLSPWRARMRALTAVATGRPFSPAYFREPELVGEIASRLERGGYDAILVFCSAMAGLLRRHREAIGDTPVVADYCDLDSAKWKALSARGNPLRRLVFGREAKTLAGMEVEVARSCRAIVFATPLEADDFFALPGGAGATDVRVIPNGVDHDHFARAEGAAAEEPTVVFTGAMDYLPNHEGALWFLDHAWPGIREEVPAARLLIVGREPRPELLARNGKDGVEVTGTVPDIRSWMHRGWVSVAPLQVARGVQNKVLEAMASSIPTIVSPAVSRGLEARAGVETFVASEPGDWVARTVRLLRSSRLRQGLGVAGLEYVRSRHDWNAHGTAWKEILATTTGERSLRGVA